VRRLATDEDGGAFVTLPTRPEVRTYARLVPVVIVLALPTTAAALPPECQVRAIDSIPESSGHPSFSPDGERLAYYGLDSEDSYQLWIARSDGTDRECITCSQAADGPAVARHKVGPAWHPSGRFIAINVEVSDHPIEWWRKEFWAQFLFDNGLWEALWITTPDGSRWWKLVDVTTSREDGVFHSAFSPDGRRLVWGQLVHRAQEPDHPWGVYRMKVADFAVSDGGTPSLENVRDISPEGGELLEPGGFTRDGRLVFGGDMDSQGTTHLGTGDLDVWELHLATGQTRNLTADDDWDEHPSYSPDGRLISYLNVSEIDLMNADGSGTERLTRFNDWSAEQMWRTAAKEWPVIPTSTDWSPDGTKLAVSVQSIWRYPRSWLAVLQFAGPCGLTVK
jgi:Tol biopolymer transport system component